MNTTLAGLTVVITRPAHQAQPLCDSILHSSGKVVLFPVIEIKPPANPEKLQSQLASLKSTDFAIFTSANAVDASLQALGGAPHWPEGLSIVAVGRATANKLTSCGLHVNLIAPEPFNSEALLTLPQLQKVSGQKVLIFRGEGGRELLAQTLHERGADVDYVECYRRAIPHSDTSLLYQCWDESRILLIIVTSNEGLQNLATMVDANHREKLLASTLLVVSERAMEKARELGFTQSPILASAASNEAIMEALQQWQTNRTSP